MRHVPTDQTTVHLAAPDVSSAADVSEDVIGCKAPAGGLAPSADERSPTTSGDSSADTAASLFEHSVTHHPPRHFLPSARAISRRHLAQASNEKHPDRAVPHRLSDTTTRSNGSPPDAYLWECDALSRSSATAETSDLRLSCLRAPRASSAACCCCNTRATFLCEHQHTQEAWQRSCPQLATQ